MDPKQLDNLSIYWVPYKDGKFQFEPARDRLSLKGKITSDGKGTVTSTLVELVQDDKNFVDYTDVSNTPGLLVIYGRDGTVGMIPNTRVAQTMYPFAGLLQTGSGVDYEPSANVAGCVKCHTDPYLKHGYIYGAVNGDAKTDFQDPVEALHYEHHITMPYPTHEIGNCESCHVKGTYDVPDQSASLPGLLSASAKNETCDRRIGTVPAVVTGPAVKACGGCHRTDLINEDKAGGLAVLNRHFEQGGYLIPAGEKPVDTWQSTVNEVMSLFK